MLEEIGILSYATKSNGIGGRIKDEPEDFVVEEVWGDKVVEACNFRGKELNKELPSEKKEYVWFTLEKKDWDTFKIIKYISNFCGVSKKRFTYSGTKDKFAVSAQRMCAWKVPPEKILNFGARDVWLYDAEASDTKMELGDHSKNRFVVRIRDPTSTDVSEFLKEAENGLPNFFGQQRFGTRFNSHLVGKEILKEDFEGAVRNYLTATGEREHEETRQTRQWLGANWGEFKVALDKFPRGLRPERTLLSHLSLHPNDYANALRKLPKGLFKMFVHAYQSYLFNLVLSERMKIGLDKKLEGDDNPLTCPLFGYSCELLEGEAGEIERKVLEGEGISLEDFRIGSMPEASGKGIRRQAMLSFKNLKVIPSEGDLIAEFDIPAGSYATVLLEELMKVGAKKEKEN